MMCVQKPVDSLWFFPDSCVGGRLPGFLAGHPGKQFDVSGIFAVDDSCEFAVTNLPDPQGDFWVLDADKDKPDVVQLGHATYMRHSRRLFHADGQEIFLRAQSAELLDFLASRLGQLVSRDRLVDLLWPDVAVTDDSLTQCIRDVRKAIGDVDRKTLATIPRRGFVLHGTTARLQDGPPAMVRSESLPQESAAFENQTVDIVPQLDPRDVLPTLAILPFRGEHEGALNIFGIFLADEIAKLLGMSEDVNVISRMSTGTLGGNPPEVLDARRALNADFVLSGYMVARGDQVALSLEFSDTESGFALWSERLQLPFDPISANTEGLELVVANIRRAIMLHEGRRVSSRPIRDLKLFSMLHGAIGLMHRLSPKDFHKAKTFLDRLNELVPNHPAPLAWTARWHVMNSAQGWVEDPRKEASTALDYTARALDMDPYHTHALVCEGQVLMHLAHDLTEAEHRFDLALQNNPNDANGRSLRGTLMGFTDRADRATRDTERALHLTPMDPHRFMYLTLAAGACIAAEDFDRALTLVRESLRLNRAHMSSLRILPVALLGAGDEARAREAVKDLLAAQPGLTVSQWLRSAPSSEYQNGNRFAAMLRKLGVPN